MLTGSGGPASKHGIGGYIAADRDAYRAAEHARAKLGKGYIIEYRYKHALSGEYRWARETAAAPYDTASGRRLFDSYILDITEQKRAEAALRVSEERYRAVVEDQSEYIRRFDRRPAPHLRQRRAVPAIAEDAARTCWGRLPAGDAGGRAEHGP